MSKEKKYPKAIYNWPEDERPREKVLDHVMIGDNKYISFYNE